METFISGSLLLELSLKHCHKYDPVPPPGCPTHLVAGIPIIAGSPGPGAMPDPQQVV